MPSSIADMYPLSFDQRVQELDNLREDTLRLESKLSDIRKACEESSLCPNPIVECPEHMSQIAQAYKEFYLSDEPNRWHSNLKKYREDLQAMFNDPGEYTLADIHERARNELRQAQRSDLCTIRPDDSEETIKWKNESAAMFDEGKSVTDIIDHRLKSQLETLPESEAAEKSHFLKALEDSRDSKDRARAYVDYYCHQMPNDSREKASLKAKFAKMFQDGISHDILMTMMVKQVTETGATKKSDLENKLSELQMAQSAFLKNKAKKEETVSRRLQAQVEAEKTVTCSFPECNAPVNLLAEDGPLECAICEWLSRRSSSKSQFFYCSIEHAEKDFPLHDRMYHSCVMGDKCIYAPLSGPPEDGITGGICRDCKDHDITSYFCSPLCYKDNLESHQAEFHVSKGIENRESSLDLFENNV